MPERRISRVASTSPCSLKSASEHLWKIATDEIAAILQSGIAPRAVSVEH
jgi:hypothetical protein